MEWLALAFMLALPSPESCTPARWRDAAPESLELLRGSPVTCVLVEEPAWKEDLLEAARKMGLLTLAVVRGGDAGAAARALEAGAEGIAAEGGRSERLAAWVRERGRPLVEIVPRSELRIEPGVRVVATYEGLWAGVRTEKDETKAQPTGGPWIETNSGVLRFLRAAAPPETAVWIAHPAPAEPQPASRYVQAIADAAACGAKWVLDFDADFWRRVRSGEPKGKRDWERVMAAARFFQEREPARWKDASALAVVLDEESGGLVSGGILDMITAKHIPLRAVPPGALPRLSGELRTLLTIEPGRLSQEQREAARAAARRGATLVNGPAGWKLEPPPPGRFTYSDEQVKQLDQIWREVNSIIGRRNYGVRLFGAPGMLSTLKESPDGKNLAVILVNYTDYPVENITLHFAGRMQRARLLDSRGERVLETYEVEDGTGVDVERVDDLAVVVAERADQPKREARSSIRPPWTSIRRRSALPTPSSSASSSMLSQRSNGRVPRGARGS
jgi:hypothetical protein